jgi:intracellular septation protein
MVATPPKKHWFPFTAEQCVNILSEFGPLVTMFVVNAIYSKTDPELFHGTVALIGTTILAMIVMWIVLKRLPVFPVIASAVTVVFGLLTIYTHNPMWVQIKVTIFNVMFALFLFGGLWFGKNFFKYVFEKTFHYSEEGWNRFTWSFAWFFVLTAVLNEAIRLFFPPPSVESIVACKKLAAAAAEMCLDRYRFNLFGWRMDGVNIWILFKVAFIMPLSGLYAWYLTRLMQKYRIDPPDGIASAAPQPAGVVGTEAHARVR